MIESFTDHLVDELMKQRIKRYLSTLDGNYPFKEIDNGDDSIDNRNSSIETLLDTLVILS